MENNYKNISVREIILTGLITALVFIGGKVIQINTLAGFIHAGDFMVLLAPIILGKKLGMFSSSVGMALVDISSGYIIWAPFTFIIKGAMAFIVGSIVEDKELNNKNISIALGTAGIFMVLAYFLSGAIIAGFLTENLGIIGGIAYASKDIIGNIVQISVAIILAFPLARVLRKEGRRVLRQ